jgi:LysR family transcriptional regulator, transcriptional activator of the cysJI operon
VQFESLKLFCDLAETKSFTQAAQRNRVTQSSASQMLCALERQFESLLVERSRRNFRLTPAGQVLYDSGKELLQIQHAMHSAMEELAGSDSGEIRLATDYSIGLHDLPSYVKEFLRRYPAVNLQVEYRRANEVYQDVIANDVDLGLVAYPAQDRRLQIIPLWKDPLVLICHPQHPLAKLKSVQLDLLNGLKFLSFAPDLPTRKAVDKILADAGVWVVHAMQFDNIETVKRAVEIDAGVAIVPRKSIREEPVSQTLQAVEIEGGHFRPLALIHKTGKVLSPAAKHLIAVLQEVRAD